MFVKLIAHKVSTQTPKLEARQPTLKDRSNHGRPLSSQSSCFNGKVCKPATEIPPSSAIAKGQVSWGVGGSWRCAASFGTFVRFGLQSRELSHPHDHGRRAQTLESGECTTASPFPPNAKARDVTLQTWLRDDPSAGNACVSGPAPTVQRVVHGNDGPRTSEGGFCALAHQLSYVPP